MGAIVRYNNLTGGLNTVQGINTINQSVKRTESPDLQNVEYYKLGGLCSMQGNQIYGNQLNKTITLGYEYIYGNDKYMIVCTNDGTVYRYNTLSNSFVSIYKFPTATQRHSICSFNNGIVISNGIDDLVFYQYNRNDLLTGTITISNNSNTVNGNGTKFTTQLSKGDYITIDGLPDKYKVASIDSDTSLTLSKNLEFENEQTWYAYSKDDNTYYVDNTANTTTIPVYSINESNTLTKVSDTGSINNNILTVPVQTEQTVTGIRYDSWTQPNITSNTSWGTISNFNICNDNGVAINSSSYTMTWTFPETMEVTGVSYNYMLVGVQGGSFSAEFRDEDNNLIGNDARIGQANSNVNRNITFINPVKTNKITCIFKFSVPGAIIANVNTFTLLAKQPVEYEYKETTTTYETFNRDDSKDKTLSIALTGVSYYLTDISELNAVYTTRNQEGEIDSEFNVRGLALNSYQGRIFVGGTDGILYYSEVGLIHGWELQYGAGAIPTFYDDNSDFTALGLFDKYLVICKRERSYILDGTDVDDGNWTIQPYSDYTCDSQQSWLVCNNSFLVYARNPGGIYPLMQRTIYNANYQGLELSTKIRDDFDKVSQAKFDYIFPVYLPKKKYIMFYMPIVSGNGSNTCYIYDLQTKTWLKRVVSQNVTCAFRFNNDVYIGTQDGLILKEFSGTTFNGEPIKWYWKSPWFSFGDGSNYLSTREFRINLSEDGANRFKINIRRDGIETFKSRYINRDSNNYVGLDWESAVGEESLTDTVWDEDNWTSTKHTIKRFPLPNQYFQTIQIEFNGATVDEGFNIYGFEFHGIQLEEVPY